MNITKSGQDAYIAAAAIAAAGGQDGQRKVHNTAEAGEDLAGERISAGQPSALAILEMNIRRDRTTNVF